MRSNTGTISLSDTSLSEMLNIREYYKGNVRFLYAMLDSGWQKIDGMSATAELISLEAFVWTMHGKWTWTSNIFAGFNICWLCPVNVLLMANLLLFVKILASSKCPGFLLHFSRKFCALNTAILSRKLSFFWSIKIPMTRLCNNLKPNAVWSTETFPNNHTLYKQWIKSQISLHCLLKNASFLFAIPHFLKNRGSISESSVFSKIMISSEAVETSVCSILRLCFWNALAMTFVIP